MAGDNSLKLVIEDDNGRKSVVPVTLGEVVVGRQDGSAIRLNERNVSRRHLRLVREENGVFAEDLDSYNGVYINGDRVKGRAELRNGDVIRVGDFQLELRGDLPTRREEPTQKTLVPTEVTRPDIRLDDSRATGPLPEAEMLVDPPEVQEPTSIIRMETPEPTGEKVSSRAIAAGARAKLVCVSSHLAGKEFEIGKSEVTVGRRANENDIGIEHRSVSRFHAKIIATGKGYKLFDLKSANGTLVNGEEYAQTDLKRGDLLEFGHVKFRFVPASENYVFTAEEARILQGDTSTGGFLSGFFASHRGLIFSIVGLLVLISGMLGWLIASHWREKRNVNPTVDVPELETLAIESPNTKAGFEDLLVQAQAAMNVRDFEKAAALCRAALAVPGNASVAQQCLQKAEGEIKARATYERAVHAVDRSQWGDAWSALKQVPENSSSYEQAKALNEQIRNAYAMELAAKSNQAINEREFSEAEQWIEQLGAVDSSHAELAHLREQLANGVEEERARRAKNLASKALVPRNNVVVAPQKPPIVVPSGESSEDLYAKGAQAYQRGQYNEAIEHYNRCLKADRKNCLCYRAMGIVYAKTANRPKAAFYYTQFVKTCPEHPDAPKVKELLKVFEAGNAP